MKERKNGEGSGVNLGHKEMPTRDKGLIRVLSFPEDYAKLKARESSGSRCALHNPSSNSLNPKQHPITSNRITASLLVEGKREVA